MSFSEKSELWLVLLNYLRDQRDNVSSYRDVEVAGLETLTVVGWRDVVGFDEEEGRDSVTRKVVEVSKRVFEVKIHG